MSSDGRTSSCSGRIRKNIVVATIDGFQGSEADVVVLSTVRTSALGFLSDVRRMNVALTRAKRAVVVLGSSSVLSSENASPWARWLAKYGGQNSNAHLFLFPNPGNAYGIS